MLAAQMVVQQSAGCQYDPYLWLEYTSESWETEQLGWTVCIRGNLRTNSTKHFRSVNEECCVVTRNTSPVFESALPGKPTEKLLLKIDLLVE